jgi:hypothetical protein
MQGAKQAVGLAYQTRDLGHQLPPKVKKLRQH